MQKALNCKLMSSNGLQLSQYNDANPFKVNNRSKTIVFPIPGEASFREVWPRLHAGDHSFSEEDASARVVGLLRVPVLLQHGGQQQAGGMR